MFLFEAAIKSFLCNLLDWRNDQMVPRSLSACQLLSAVQCHSRDSVLKTPLFQARNLSYESSEVLPDARAVP